MLHRFRISPAWWPALALLSPVIGPWLVSKTRRFHRGREDAEERNKRRIESAKPLELPSLHSLEITVVVEQRCNEGFMGSPAVSYCLRSDLGSMLMDVGFGSEHPAFVHNVQRLGLSLKDVEAVVISHLHLDHMGGMAAQRKRRICLPSEFAAPGDGSSKLCHVPDVCSAEGLDISRVEGPRLLEAGIATTGPLARMLFFAGMMEEQALVAHLKGKGLVVLTGCGHPTIEVILRMVRQLSDAPLYAVGGGMHFPVTRSRIRRAGVELQQLFGTGKSAWRRVDDQDLDHTINVLNEAAPKRLYLSAHDTCDYALSRLLGEVNAKVEVLRAGATYKL